MGLVRTALIFGAGYALGHPAGRAKVTELARRPEVEQLRQKAAATASTGLEAGKKQIAQATDKGTDKGTTASSPGAAGGRRLPAFPRRRSHATTTAATSPATAQGGLAGTADLPGTSPTPPVPPAAPSV